ncbi:uncharacterized protein LOC115629146 isoform X3 [Scaptodrosophila lebanonensis]|uniref:Uncharacterized protein LOC115629146 isoform X3 n=1 Tax=Drosophila lebanonensis TaxID=7225 RepID=A0A6J2U2L3_DROLE|nr:uncharacterized protein LOC115629146 isoform X3 [Scaptodrosophila lebanonensis]
MTNKDYTSPGGNNNNSGHSDALRLEIPGKAPPPEQLNYSASNNSVYSPTTTALPPKTLKKKKKKRRDKSDLGDDFVAPDGGWGWLVAIASGINILVTFALAQQFGLIFRNRMSTLGISSSQLTTIINIQIAVSAFTGLLNGPLFRRFTFRAVALVGSVLTFLGLFMMVFADTFEIYVLSFSIIYGFGRGLTVSASSLAVITYFKQKRRTATAYQFGVAGLGPIVCPFFATYMIKEFGVQGTVLLFAGASLHTIACSLIYQPVKWHVVKRDKDAEALKSQEAQKRNPDDGDDDDDDIIKQGADPETPVLARANDGWFGSRSSLSSNGTRNRVNTSDRLQQQQQQQQQHNENGGHVELKRLNSRDFNAKQRSFSVSHSIKEEEHDDDHNDEKHVDDEAAQPLTDLGQKLQVIPAHRSELARQHVDEDDDDEEEERRKKLPIYRKIIIFFDLDLLRDLTYVNLAVGITLINFVEINFAILTPFILHDLGFNDHQTAVAMSALGFCDLVVRFLVPLISANINLSNRTFFVVGILGMCVGRAFLSLTSNFYFLMAIFIWLGLNKAFRTVFWSLIIPSHVPLKRLPAAAGLQLLMSGTFSMAFGPVIVRPSHRKWRNQT